MDRKDEHGLKLESVEPTFSGFNTMPAKVYEKYYGFCSLMKFLRYLLRNSTGVVCVWLGALGNGFSTEMT